VQADLHPQQISDAQGSRGQQRDDQTIAVIAARSDAISVRHPERRRVQDFPRALNQIQSEAPELAGRDDTPLLATRWR